MKKLTPAQASLLDSIRFWASRGQPLSLHGVRLRVAENLAKKGLVTIEAHGTPYVTKGWYLYALPKSE